MTLDEIFIRIPKVFIQVKALEKNDFLELTANLSQPQCVKIHSGIYIYLYIYMYIHDTTEK